MHTGPFPVGRNPIVLKRRARRTGCKARFSDHGDGGRVLVQPETIKRLKEHLDKNREFPVFGILNLNSQPVNLMYLR